MKSIVTNIKDNILLFYEEIHGDQHHRYRSWEHCYLHFQRLRSNSIERDLDAASLHLAFFLASWGMYRGSSRLLQKDYRVHTRIVKEILDEKYSPLWHLFVDSVECQTSEVNLVFQLIERLREIYAELQVSGTDTLVTKVLLGTICCIPAHDALFGKGVAFWNQELPAEFKPKFPACLGTNSYRGLVEFCLRHNGVLGEVQAVTAKRGITYPVMKLADMYFWNLGYQLKP